MIEQHQNPLHERLRTEPRAAVIWLFFSPASLILVGLHSFIVLAWCWLFWGPQVEVPVMYFVFCIDIVPMLTLNWLVERLLVLENGPFLYVVVMGGLGTIQWSCIGAGLTALWRRRLRNQIDFY